MITIDQLLESVDLFFEPRWITKDECGAVAFWEKKPTADKKSHSWYCCMSANQIYPSLKLSEFSNKNWQECIYEVPRKEEPKDKIKIGTLYIDKNVTFGDGDDDDVGVSLEDYEVPRKTTEKIERFVIENDRCGNVEWWDVVKKINELVDMVNNIISVQEKMIDSRFVVDAINELKERTEPKKLTGFAKTLSDLDISKPMSTYTNKRAKNE